MPKQRYNAKIQRAKGLLEIAAAMYETSLSFQTTRAAEKVLQTESRIGHELELKLISANRDGSNSAPLSFAADSFAEIKGVADGKYTLAWVNPTAAATLAYRGTGPFKKKLRCASSRLFHPTTLWALLCTNRPALRPFHKSPRSAFRCAYQPI